MLKKILLLNIAQKSAQKSAQKRDKLLKWDKFAQKSAQKSQIYSFLSRVLKKSTKKRSLLKKENGYKCHPKTQCKIEFTYVPTVLAKI